MKKTFTYKDLKKPKTILGKVIKYTVSTMYFLGLFALVSELIIYSNNLSSLEKDELYKALGLVIVVGIVFNLKKILGFEFTSLGGVCDRKKFKELIRKEEFREVKNIGDHKMYESELWIKVSGVYIPKNFIKYYYVVQGGYGVHYVRFITIDGNYFSYSVGGVTKDLENTLNTIRAVLPKAKLINGDRSTTREVTKELREQFKVYFNDEFVFEDFIKLDYKFNE